VISGAVHGGRSAECAVSVCGETALAMHEFAELSSASSPLEYSELDVDSTCLHFITAASTRQPSWSLCGRPPQRSGLRACVRWGRDYAICKRSAIDYRAVSSVILQSVMLQRLQTGNNAPTLVLYDCVRDA